MILHLLSPESGMLSKRKQEQWHFIEGNPAPMLFQSADGAKGKEYMCHLAAIAMENAALDKHEQCSTTLWLL